MDILKALQDKLQILLCNLNLCKLNNTFLNDPEVKKKKINIIKCIELSLKNESTIYQNMWDVTKAVLRGKLIVPNGYIRNKEKFEINYKISYINKL